MKRNKNIAANTPVSRRSFRFTFGHLLLFFSGMLLMAVIQSFLSGMKPGGVDSTGRHASTAHAAVDGKVQSNQAAVAGQQVPDWGELQIRSLALNRPHEYFVGEVIPVEPTVWFLREVTQQELLSFFSSLDLGADAKSFLTAGTNWQQVGDGYKTTPPADVVVGLSQPTREKLYAILAKWPENNRQRNPFQFRAGGFEQWFADSGLSSDKLEIVRKLTYEQRGNLCFSDAPAFSQLATADETMNLVKSLWRVSTLMVSVRITPETNLKPLVDYWGHGGRAHAYLPMLESISREGGSAVSITYFMPGFPRMRLFTYPNPRDPRAIREDCFWSAMNFFNEQPDDRFFDPEETQRSLKEDYLQVKDGRKQFGDVLLLLGAGNKALHMCVHIADDVVFTKNGFNAAQPWVLMRLNEMLGAYEAERPFEVRVYRRKELPGPASLAERGERRSERGS